MNHRNRAGSFALGFLALGAHLHDLQAGPLAWGLLVLQFIVYPHLVYWHARRAAHAMRAELGAVVLDGALFGVWTAALGFPVSIAVLLLISAVVSHTALRGLRTLPTAGGAIAAGVLLGIALTGWHPRPHTGPVATALCIVCLVFYLLIVAQAAHARALDLQRARDRLRQGERALTAANERLRRQLDDIQRLEARLRDQAHRDPLTGLHNRRYLDVAMQAALARCRREGEPLSVVLLDIDHFKQVNDTHGHQAGDAVLDHLAGLLRSHTRAGDVACRYGGEEFLLLLPGVSAATALERAEACREAFGRARVAFGQVQVAATLSIGVATCEAGQGVQPAQLLRQADDALYRAKRAGRNRVASHASPRTAAA